MMNVVDVMVGAGSAVAIIGGANKAIIKPTKVRWHDWQNNRLFIRGRKAIPDISPALLPASQRLSNLEEGQIDLKRDNVEIKTTLSKVVDQLAKVVDEVAKISTTVSTVDKKVTANGGDTNDLGDLVKRNSQHAGTWIDGGEQTA